MFTMTDKFCHKQFAESFYVLKNKDMSIENTLH